MSGEYYNRVISILACFSMIDFKYRNNHLDMTVVYQSQNIFWIQPGNLLVLRNIQNDVTNALEYNIGKIELVVISAHIYKSDFEQVNSVLKDTQLL